MKKILITIIMALLFVCCTYTVSLGWQAGSASAPTLGTTWGNGANYMMIDNDNVYCLQYGESLKGTPSYTVKMKVEIRGCDAKFYNSSSNLIGKTSCNENNVLAAILTPNDYLPNEPSCRQTDWDWYWGMCSSKQAAISLGNGHRDYIYYSRAQLAIYGYMQTWLNACSQNGVNLDWEFYPGTYEPVSHDDGQGYIWGSLANCQGVADLYTCNVDVYYLESSSHQNLLIAIPDDGDPGKPDPEPPTTSVTVKKEWKSDSDNAYENRAEVTVELKADGKVIKTTKLNSSNKWTYTFEDLPTGVTYSVSEVSVPGYTSKVTKNSETSFTITNTLKTTSVKVTKKWADENNRDELRKQVTVTLYETIDGTKSVSKDASGKTRTGTLSTTDDSTCTFSNLPTHRNGKEIKYTVEETVPDKYTVSYSGNGTSNVTITNTHIPKVKISVTKVWNDCDNRDVKRPNSVEATLYANDVEKETVELNSSNSWKHTFNDLPTSEDGSEIKYTVKEKSVPTGYTATITEGTTNTFTITNTYEPEKTQVKVTKKWEDNENEEGLRPSAVTVVLYANGKATNNTITLSDANGWTGTFENLYKNQDGAEIKYTVQEAKETDAFTHVDGTTLENGKVIKDANGNEFVWVEVPKDTTVYSSSTLNLNLDELTGTALTNAYNAIEKDLQNYVSAFRQDGYSDIHSGDDTYLGMTNEQYTTLKQKMLKSIFKNGGFYVGRYETGIYGGWRTESGATGHNPVIKKDAYPYNRVSISQAQSLASSFGTTDYRSSLMFGIQWDLMLKYLQTKGVSESDLLIDSLSWGNTKDLEHNITSTTAHYSTDLGINWSKTPFNKTSEDRIILTAGADELFYKQNISDLAGNLHEMTLEFNTASSKHVTRGSYHGSINKWAVKNAAARQNSTKDAGNDGKGFRVTLFKDEDIIYAPADYSSTITGDAETGYIITNTYTTEKTEIEVKKEWEDYNNQDGIRPTSVTVTLYKNGISTGKTETLSENNGWTAKFENLNKYENGKEVDYTVEEKVPDGYIVDIRKNEDGQIIVTNSHTPERTEIEVIKVWEGDDNDAYATRPSDIEVKLYKNGKETDKSLILSEDNGWKGTFEDLYKYENGELIEYSIKEIEVKDYVTHITGNSTIGFTITNTLQNKPIPEGIVITNEHIPEKVSVTVKKEWDDQDNIEGLRKPITITLYEKTEDDKEPRVSKDENGNARTITLTEPNWEGKFENLYKYEYKGKLITYSVKEEKFEPYETTYSVPSYDDNGNVTIKVTNKYEPQYDGYVELSGIVWMDGFAGKSNDIDGVLGDNYSLVEDGKVKIRLFDGNTDPIQSTYSDENGNLTRTDYAVPSKEDGTYTIRINYDNSKNVYRLYEDKENVDKKLKNAYVEFEYDGMKYTTVRQETKGEDTSKAKEDEDIRINDKYSIDKSHSTVTSETDHPDKWSWEDKKITAETEKISSYKKGSVENRDETIRYCYGNGRCDRTKHDDPTEVLEGISYTCRNCPKEEHEIKAKIEVEKIPNINLGLFEREQPDVALFSDISKVEVEMNGQRYTYIYGVRSNNPKFVSDIQAKFQNKDTYTYKRPVNPADIAYIDKVNANAMEVYVTYEIKVANLSKSLLVNIGEIVNAYDKNYEIISVIKGDTNVNWKTETVYPSSEFNQIKLTGLNIQLEGEQEATANDTIQIRYRIGQDKLSSLFNNEPPLNNASEILSYSTKYGATTLYAEQQSGKRANQPYGGYDYNSHPGNAEIFINSENRLDAAKPEDDTDIAPAFVLCRDSNSKILAGTVFEDTDARSNDERAGDGKYDASNEKTVQNVKVNLYEEKDDGSKTLATLYDSSGNEITNGATKTTDGNGNYSFEGIVTGKKYFIEFVYGDEDVANPTKINGDENRPAINGRDYKSTIITEPILKQIFKTNNNNMYWYIDIQDNHSVAIDDIEVRKAIEPLRYNNFDAKLNMKAKSNAFISKLEFTGGTEGKSDEEGNVKDSAGNIITNVLSKLDFGIIERPREDLVIQKTITYIKLVLANGQILVEGNPSDPNSNMNYIKVMGFANNITTGRAARSYFDEKQLLIELDTELIQGSKLEMEYKVAVTNNNEIDYDYDSNQNYYYYGEVPTGEEPLPAKIEFVDYLCRDLNYDETKNEDWKLLDSTILNEYKDVKICPDAYDCVYKGTYKALQSSSGAETTIKRGDTSNPLKMYVTKLLANKDENVYDNGAEIIQIDGKTARTIQYIEEAQEDRRIQKKSYKPGNYEPSLLPEELEQDDDRVKVIITPPTGIVNYIITYVIAGLVGLVVIATGVIFIKKKVLLKEERR